MNTQMSLEEYTKRVLDALPAGELVDLHQDYENCKCFLSDDGIIAI